MDFIRQIAEHEIRLEAGNAARHAQACVLPAGIVSYNNAAVAGRDNTLFIANGLNRWEAQIAGLIEFDAGWHQTWRAALQTRHQICSKKGIALAHLVMPEKQIVLPDIRWAEAAPSDFPARPLRCIAWESAGPAGLVYPAEDFAAARDWSNLYWRWNSHCTPSSCIMAGRKVMTAFGLAESMNESRIDVVEHSAQHDLIAHFYAPAPACDGLAFRRPGKMLAFQDVQKETGTQRGSSYVIQNPDAPVAAPLAIFGDSYSWRAGIGDVLAYMFQTVHFIWQKDIDWGYVDRHSIRFLLWESAERFLATPPLS